jgi:hypothetical protein
MYVVGDKKSSDGKLGQEERLRADDSQWKLAS